MSDQNIMGSYGAVDLSQSAPAGSPKGSAAAPPSGAGEPTGATIEAALISDVSEESFEEMTALSQTVPVVLVFFSGRSVSSQAAVEILEQAARRQNGAFVLGKIDVDTQQALAAALQIQNLPTCIALVARQPVPMFEGSPSAEQFDALMQELLQVAPQLGVTGRVTAKQELVEEQMPAAHVAPRAAEEAGDWSGAISLWKKVLANSPADHEAQLALARAEFQERQTTGDGAFADDPLALADRLFGAGREAEAFDALLAIVAGQVDPDAKEAARTRLVELFKLAADSETVKKARTSLANTLMV